MKFEKKIIFKCPFCINDVSFKTYSLGVDTLAVESYTVSIESAFSICVPSQVR